MKCFNKLKHINKKQKEKIIISIQCLISVIAVIWLINAERGRMILINGNTGEMLNFLEGFVVFNFFGFFFMLTGSLYL